MRALWLLPALLSNPRLRARAAAAGDAREPAGGPAARARSHGRDDREADLHQPVSAFGHRRDDERARRQRHRRLRRARERPSFFATHDTDTRDTTRFTLVGDNAADLDLKSKPVVDFLAYLKAKKTVINPTCNAFEDLLVGKQGEILPGLEPLMARLPVQVQRWYLEGGVPHEGKDDLYKRSYDKLLAMVKALADAKVTVVAGTDSLAGLMLHHKLELFVRGGIKPADAIRMATLEPARVMKRDKTSGSVEKGKIANLVVVDGDPLAKISDLGKVVSTVKSGVVYASTPLYAAVGVRPAVR